VFGLPCTICVIYSMKNLDVYSNRRDNDDIGSRYNGTLSSDGNRVQFGNCQCIYRVEQKLIAEL